MSRAAKAPLVALSVWAFGALLLRAWLALPPPEPPPRGSRETPVEKGGADFFLEDYLGKADTLASTLERNGFSAGTVQDVVTALSPHVHLSRLQPGDRVEFRFGDGAECRSVRLHRGLVETYRATRDGAGWRGEREVVAITRETVAVSGALKGSLFRSLSDLNESAALALAFAEIFAWDFDFFTESQEGDRFSLVVEKLHRDDRFVGYGTILAAVYDPARGGNDLAAFFFEPPGGSKGHYDRRGQSLRKAFLKAPLTYDRVSSRFTFARRHPILGRVMPHLGVDYAAPAGTTVHAVAEGVVQALSREGAGGNSVTLRHAMGYQSLYQHLSRFAKDLRVGRRVSQKDVIGYVGATGRATGPHLDFRLRRYGRPVNPLREIFPPGPPLRADLLPVFERQVARLLLRLDYGDGR